MGRSPTKGWRKASPRRRGQRRELRENCGTGCFLLPDKLKFPICRACRHQGSSVQCSCKRDCRGLLAAKIRARQWGYPEVARKAHEEAERTGCRWSRSPRRKSRK